MTSLLAYYLICLRQVSHKQKQRTTTKSNDFPERFKTRLLICLGVLTTLWSTLSFITVLANNPDIQEKIQKEIDSVLGNNDPSLLDRHEMHYTSAVSVI